LNPSLDGDGVVCGMGCPWQLSLMRTSVWGQVEVVCMGNLKQAIHTHDTLCSCFCLAAEGTTLGAACHTCANNISDASHT
jgi:hypothetical protein